MQATVAGRRTAARRPSLSSPSAGTAAWGRRLALALAITLSTSSPGILAQERGGRELSSVRGIPAVSGDTLVAFVSDSQPPIFVETLKLHLYEILLLRQYLDFHHGSPFVGCARSIGAVR